MALQILNKKGIFHLEGKINCSTAKSFITHFEHYILRNKKTIINIDKIKKIDSDGLDSIKKLMKIALRNKKKFFTIGLGARDIYNHFDIV